VFADVRHQRILELLARDGRVATTQIAADLEVSLDTVRRDLERLDDAGVLRKVRGGALPPVTRVPAALGDRSVRRSKQKAAIGAAAARLVAKDAVVLLGGGATVVELARQWPAPGPSTVLTTSLDVALELAHRDDLELVLLGGRVLPDEHTVAGAETVAALAGLRADACVLGTCALDAHAGMTLLRREEAHVGRAMVAAARRTLVLAGAEKLGTVGPFPVAAAEAIATVVTGEGASEEVAGALADRGVEVVRT